MATWDPTVTVRALQPVVSALDTLGHDTASLLAAATIPAEVLTNPDGRIAHRSMMTFWERAVMMTGDDQLGLHLAEAAPLDSFEIHAYAMLSSSTLRDAYHRACRYQRLIHEATHLELEIQSSEGILRHYLPGGRSVPHQPAEFLAALWIRFGRLVTDTHWNPSRVDFAHDAPRDVGEHERIFQAPVQFRMGCTAMHIPSTVLNTPNPHSNQGLLSVLDRYAELLVNHAPKLDTVSDRVRSQLLNDLQGGVLTAEAVATSLRLSVRSLHRALKKEGTSFQTLVDQLRHEHALKYLANPRINIAEIAFLLGFAEVSSFHKAFSRWTGETPATVRAKLLNIH